MREIQGEAKTLRQLLSGAKYTIDYYQREYRWGTKQVQELLEDLAARFLEDFDSSHSRAAVETYGHYFLGSVIISRKKAQNFIVDGQQRLTTLTLLLIHLHNLQRYREDAVSIESLIFSEKFGRRSFNVDVDERTACMEALFNEEPFEVNGNEESVQNILGRYGDIGEHLPEELTAEALPYFVDWLIENVQMVEITAHSDEDAYAVFETMNDRGLSLTPTEMLKGYLLAKIEDEGKKNSANGIWKDRISGLSELGKEEDSDFFKAWLRSQYARNIRERKKGAKPEDFDRIATEYHRWVQENRELVGLHQSPDFDRFIHRDLSFYAKHYRRLRLAAWSLTLGLEEVHYNAQLGFTLQYPVLLAPLTTEDQQPEIDRKLRVVAAYLDILLARRLWNFRSISYSTMQYAMFLTMRDIRGLEPEDLAGKLRARLDADGEKFSSNDYLRMHQQNRRHIHYLLARITDHLERSAGGSQRFVEYMNRGGKNGYEIEHIWANKPEWHTDEFHHPSEFAEYRNRIGGLLLLPKSFNASYGSLPYEDKLKHYNAQNLLARSLHPECYEHNPGFLKYAQHDSLPFKSHQEFKRADLDARQSLYRELAERVWDPRRLEWEATR